MQPAVIRHPLLENILLAFLWVVSLSFALSSVGVAINVETAPEEIIALDLSQLACTLLSITFFTHALIIGYDIFLFRKYKISIFVNAFSIASYVTVGVLLIVLHTQTIGMVASIVYFSVLILRRVLALFANHHRRAIILNSIFIFLLSLLAIVCGLGGTISGVLALALVAIYETFSALLFIIMMAFKRMKLGLLIKIIHKTYASEIFIGLISMIIAFSIALYFFDDAFIGKGIGDCLWYCFAVVTTIGFGDFAAVSIVGRILSVILGFYGIVFTAVITSIIVNLYMETKDAEGNPSTTEREGEVSASDPIGFFAEKASDKAAAKAASKTNKSSSDEEEKEE